MILQIVAIVLLILLIIIAAVLLIPFHVSLSGSVNLSAVDCHVKLSWLGITLWRNKPRRITEKKGQPEMRGSKKRPLRLAPLFFECIPAFEILIRSVKRAVRIRHLRTDLVIGTGDAADTAVLAGILWSISSVLHTSFPAAEFNVRPDLENISLDVLLNTEVAIRVGFILVGFLLAYTKRPFRLFVSEVRSAR